MTGQRHETMPRLPSAARLQSLALSFNQLSSLPPLHALHLHTLNVAHNAITQLPADLGALTPNLQVRSGGLSCPSIGQPCDRSTAPWHGVLKWGTGSSETALDHCTLRR